MLRFITLRGQKRVIASVVVVVVVVLAMTTTTTTSLPAGRTVEDRQSANSFYIHNAGAPFCFCGLDHDPMTCV